MSGSRRRTSTSPAGRRALLLILALGAGLRLIGLGWGLPGAGHVCSYHPDELPLMRSVALMAQEDTWNPHFFNYGTLYIYLVALAARGLGLVGLSPFAGVASLLYLTGRLVTAVLGVATIAIVYLIGRDLGQRALGLLAALLLAVMPLHVVCSHYATVDVTATFWFVLMLWACVRIVQRGRARGDPSSGEVHGGGRWLWPALAGAALGLAAASKYTLVLGALPLALALVLGRRWTAYPFALIVAVAAFLAACPYAVLDWEPFRAGVEAERLHAAQLRTAAFVGTGTGWHYHSVRSLPMAMGTPVLVIAALGLIALPLWRGIARHRRGDGAGPGWLLLATAAVMCAVIGYPRDHFMRYTIPLLPVLALGAASLLTDLGRDGGSRRAAATGVASLLVLWSLALTTAHETFLVGSPVHDRAAAWIRKNIPAGRQVAFAGWPWFYTPPITPYQCGVASASLFLGARERWRYRFAVLDWNASTLNRERPTYLVMADVEALARPADRGGETERFLRAVKRQYVPWRSFPDRGLRRVAVNALDDAPPDWRYPSPVITIYRLRTAGSQ